MISKGSRRGATLDLDDLKYRHGKPGLTVAFRTQFANDLFAVELADLVRLDNRAEPLGEDGREQFVPVG